jgi:glycosyltransferase involved in cell wall biosynthesis
MDRILGKKVLVPCGYSGLNNPAYASYFSALPDLLRKVDHLVYHATDYRDVAFGRTNGLDRSSMIPNGADSEEFSVVKDAGFRARHGIPEDAIALLTVGTVTGLKGHAEVLDAFERASFSGRTAVLFLNGNEPEWNGEQATLLRTVRGLARQYGWRYALKYATKKILWRCGLRVGNAGSVKEKAVALNRRCDGSKRVIACELPRAELVQAYRNADLFVFASNVEYSPLVLFEACAAGLPFVSAPVGNSAEIAEWTGGGEICPAEKDGQGYTRVSPDVLARRIESLVADKDRRLEMGRHGKAASLERFNWNALSREYEGLFVGLVTGSMPVPGRCDNWPARKPDEVEIPF